MNAGPLLFVSAFFSSALLFRRLIRLRSRSRKNLLSYINNVIIYVTSLFNSRLFVLHNGPFFPVCTVTISLSVSCKERSENKYKQNYTIELLDDNKKKKEVRKRKCVP